MVSDSRVTSLLNIRTSTVTENQNVEVTTIMLKIRLEDMMKVNGVICTSGV